ncbi:C-reactive protein-like [Latimeria chalumnae]|uniref:C-reactive protein-like n=1 Tax=Latimeria chalumnae TaxID=7897 RepID=UPI0003C1318E|nr:PREDICTED: C-reactive protein-like [Latimeria chalumnae]|eukprot:XP_006004721.1 PREDICTED: C-reactive protein-like [Latimeria chalumnae]
MELVQMKCLLALSILSCFFFLSSGTGLSKKAVFFPEQTSTSFVRLYQAKSMDLHAFTLCMRLASEFTLNRDISLFSYNNNVYDNDLSVWYEKGKFSLYLAGGSKGAVFFTLPPLNTFWTHLCLTWESKTGLTAFWVNGNKSVRKVFLPGHKVHPGGVVIIGQDQDVPGGHFDASQSFVGEIADVHLWDYILSSHEIDAVYEGSYFPVGNVIDWESVKHSFGGNVKILPMNDYA